MKKVFGIFALILFLGTTACTKVGFGQSAKTDFLSKNSALDDANGEITVGGAINIERMCSNARSAENGSVLGASKVVLVVKRLADQNGPAATVCTENTKDYRSDLINNATFSIPAACAPTDGRYEASFFESSRLGTDKDLGSFKFRVAAGAVSFDDRSVTVIYTDNPNKDDRTAAHEDCDKFASPLVVKLSEDRGIRLSSPLAGIDFDILGAKSNHILKRISWPLDDAMAFIALPDRAGSVHGIDQLFGDNTTGPDGRGAANGYAALAKHDSNRDGVIDRRDRVFSSLRLWIDRDRNGVSSAGELSSLAAHNISSVDLSYDADYVERDRYGNEILYKSVAERSSGEPLLVFDIWFRLID